MNTDIKEPSGPIVIVGQPRSGSTLLTRVLNESENIIIVNDFYYLQKVDELNAWREIGAHEVEELVTFIFDKIETRSFSSPGVTLEQSIDIPKRDLHKFRKEFSPESSDSKVTCWSILNDILSGIAQLVGAEWWGWNTPQDHVHLSAILKQFPYARVICLLRAPSDVLRSYKNVSGPWHAVERYHPLAIGLAWRKASENVSAISAEGYETIFFRFEELVMEHEEVVSRLNQFVPDAMIPVRALSSFGTNSSFNAEKKIRSVGFLEMAICYAMVGQELTKRGYSSPNLDHRPFGILEFLRVSAIALGFFARHYIVNANRRKRLIRLIWS